MCLTTYDEERRDLVMIDPSKQEGLRRLSLAEREEVAFELAYVDILLSEIEDRKRDRLKSGDFDIPEAVQKLLLSDAQIAAANAEIHLLNELARRKEERKRRCEINSSVCAARVLEDARALEDVESSYLSIFSSWVFRLLQATGVHRLYQIFCEKHEQEDSDPRKDCQTAKAQTEAKSERDF